MPASAHVVVGESVRPSPPSHQQLQQPHANGPSSRFIANGTPITHNRLHKHSHSTDAQDSRQRNQDMYSKPLPTAPRESARLSRSTPMTQDADRYRAHQVQKSVDKDYPPTPSSNDHNSLSSSHGHSSASQSQNHYNHGNTYSHSPSHLSHNSIGRHRSATVAGVHGGSSAAGLDTSTSSSSSAQGHGKLRRKPVRQLEDTPSEHFKWEPGSEPIVLVSPSEEAIPIMGSTGRRNRSVGIYRDAPGSATMPANAQATYSRATGASAASSTKTIGQERYVLQEQPTQPTTLPRHHHSAHASLPGGGAGSSRTVVQNFFPASTNQEKLVYKAPSSNGHGSGNASANSSTPTPKANAFNGTANAAPSNGTNTPTPAHAKHKSYNLTMSSSDVAMLATAPAGTTGFTIPLTNSSSDERPRRRKDSHRRTTSGAVNLGASSGSQHSHHHHALSNSTTSASTEDSSHESGDGGDQTGSDMWRSGTSLSQMSQGHPSMAQKHGAQVQQQLSRSQQRISPPAATGPPNTAATQGPGSAYRRSRGISDAPAPQSHYSHTGPHVVKLHSSNSRSSKDEKRPGTATSESRSGRDDYDDDDSRDQRGRGRTKEKDTSFMGRVRSRSNSLTKAITKVTIEYPKYLVNKMSGKRESKRLGAGGSSGVLAYSEHGHGNASGEAFDGYAYPPSTSTSTTTASTSAHSPISAALPHHNHSRSNIIHPSQNPFNAQPTPAVSSKKREHKRSLSAQPALGHGLSPAPSSYAPQPRLKKPLTHKELEKRNQYRTSPMTAAKINVLESWEGVGDLGPRQSGAFHPQIQLTQQQQKYAEGGVAFPRFDKERERGEYVATSAVPYSTERSAPRRR